MHPRENLAFGGTLTSDNMVFSSKEMGANPLINSSPEDQVVVLCPLRRCFFRYSPLKTPNIVGFTDEFGYPIYSSYEDQRKSDPPSRDAAPCQVRRFKFNLPDYYVALVRALLTLEGIALAADCAFDGCPYSLLNDVNRGSKEWYSKIVQAT